ncbi:MAG: hypothetical protein KAV82_01045 [Phycisphaerae bacterium]|nr:hypothetical protein [Phycisphaerae bacterium]
MAAIDPVRLLDQHRRAAALAVAELQPPPWNAPWNPSSASGGSASRQVVPVRVVAVHEAAEEGNEQGPYLEVARQAITLPSAAKSFSLVYEDSPDQWLEIYSDLDSAPATAPYPHLVAWFAANDIALASGFTVEAVVAGEEWTVTDGDIAYTVEVAGMGAESALTATGPAVEEITYADDGDPFTAWPDAAVMQALAAEAECDLETFYAEGDYRWAFLVDAVWVVLAGTSGRETIIVKVISGGSSLVTVRKYVWNYPNWSPVGDEFEVRAHPGSTGLDYEVANRYLAFRVRDDWWLEAVPKTFGLSGTYTVVVGLTFDDDGCLTAWQTKGFRFGNGLLVAVL